MAYTNPDFYAIWAVYMGGGGVVFNILKLVWKVLQYTSQFVPQYAPHLQRCVLLDSKDFEVPFVLQYVFHLYRQYFWENASGWGFRKVAELSL